MEEAQEVLICLATAEAAVEAADKALLPQLVRAPAKHPETLEADCFAQAAPQAAAPRPTEQAESSISPIRQTQSFCR
jgi:hypothetical protein